MTGSIRQPIRSTIQLAQAGDLIAAIPHLLGFHPAESLVVVALRGPGARLLGLALRVDLPPPTPHAALAEQLCGPLVEHDTVAVTVVVVGARRSERTDDLPYAELLATCEGVFAHAGIPVVHRLWTASTSQGARWLCYDDPACTGVLPDPTASALAAASAAAGVVTYDRREDIAATLQGEDALTLARRAKLLEHASGAAEPGGAAGRGARLLRAVHEAVRRAVHGEATLTDDDVVRLAEALADHRVRDACLVFDDADEALAAGRLWTALVRATPVPECAEPACLLAFHAYVAGDGVLAGIALERAAAADSGHRLTALLRDALLVGLPPARLRDAGVHAAAQARRQLAADSP